MSAVSSIATVAGFGLKASLMRAPYSILHCQPYIRRQQMVTEVRKILLVEDNSNDAEMTMDALVEQNLGNEVVWLKDGQQALDYLYCTGDYAERSPVNPALILLDLKMPKVDGHQVLQKLKSDPHMRVIPVVVLTSSR